ncbi:MAG TPA: class I SAM-dependent methyltransferase [Bdellovibrionales bacterium]|nr:class I SAM-dependent methyltransferase [Bdellovibrionales bacterium]
MGETRLDHEMIVPALGAPFFAEHLARYHFASRYARGLHVLDVACGRGYGSFALATVADRVTAIDLDDDNLNFARKHYEHPRIAYKKVDVTKLGLEAEKYDTLVAFEIIEHLPPSESVPFLKALASCLKPGGVALISTPNHAVVRASGVPVPHFHVNNLTATELKGQLQSCFASVQMLGQLKSKGPLGNLLYALDLFHLRHSKYLRRRAAPAAEPERPPMEVPFYWRPEHGWGESSQFIFSPLLWRQAGLTVAVCKTGSK